MPGYLIERTFPDDGLVIPMDETGAKDMSLTSEQQFTIPSHLDPFICQRRQTEDILHLRWALPRSDPTSRTTK